MKPFLVLLLLALCNLPSFAEDIKLCYISDLSKHASNQKLLEAILKEELAHISPEASLNEKSAYLTSRITKIAEKLIQQGFSTAAYGAPVLDKKSTVSFNYFTLWEGGTIPLTFLVYAWPSEEYALRYNSDNSYYGSSVHSHPITCAFAVLEGRLFQKNYEQQQFYPIEKVVRFLSEDQFNPCEGAIDDLKNPFIHKLYSKGRGDALTLSLHVYGLPTEEQVMQTFEETTAHHTYHYLLKERGTITSAH